MSAGAAPHVVWILCDQLRADAVGFMGNRCARTPNLDRLARRGVIFDNLYVQSSVCMPSRGCMLTGRYPRAIRMGRGCPLLDPRETTLPEILQRANYRTGMFGKLHLTPQQYTRQVLKSDRPITDAGPFLAAAGLPPGPEDPVKRNYGFQEVVAFEDILWGEYGRWLAERDPTMPGMRYGPGGPRPGWQPQFEVGLKDVGVSPVPAALHPSAFIGASAADFFARRHREGPCFLHVSFVDPHHPWDPPEELAANYPPEEMPSPKRAEGDFVWPPTLAARAHDFSEVTPHMARTTIAYYYAMIEMIDRAVGALVEAIERAGELDNTLFVFAADHGELLGDYGLWRKGSYHYDCLIRVPGFISYPRRIAGGRRVEGLVQSIDLTSTVLGLLDLPVGDGMQGQDLSGALIGNGRIGRPWIYCELYTALWGPFVDCWTLRTQAAKLNYYPADRVGHLFDLKQDGEERNNLFDSPGRRSLRDEMLGNLLEEIRRQADPLPRVLSQF